MTTALTKPEAAQLEELETVIHHGIKTFAEVGNALLAIRDGRLYRAEYGTFEQYCQKRWGITDRRARMLIAASETVETIKKTGTTVPVSERTARPLTKLPPADQPAAWQAATAKAQSENRPVTARDVEVVVTERIIETRKDAQVNMAPDPLDGPKDQTSNKPAEAYTSETMAGLKRYWKQANKKERVAFIKWTETYEN